MAPGIIKRDVALRDLAEELGMDRAGSSDVALVNALAFEDAVDDFGREFHATQMLLGPYYGVPMTGALLGTEGGLATDAKGRVLRKDGTLPNLLAAGGAARGLSGDGGGGYLEGNGLLAAVVGGRFAGRTAAQIAYCRWLIVAIAAADADRWQAATELGRARGWRRSSVAT